jgi:hypothetical protein
VANVKSFSAKIASMDIAGKLLIMIVQSSVMSLITEGCQSLCKPILKIEDSIVQLVTASILNPIRKLG